ncbi:MAG: PKD domain-containing protein [Gemmatimonadaceae bacterium]
MRQPKALARVLLCSLSSLTLHACARADSPTSVTGRVLAPTVARDEIHIAADPVIVAAGDIVCGNNTPAGTPCKHAQTAQLIGAINPNAVLPLGDNQYENGTLTEFNTLYGPTWGAYKSITYPAVGNHEYQTPNASGYFDYFNGVGVQTGRAGDRSKGYYSFDVGAWHLIALNSNCASIGGCGAGSAQEAWLRADLAAHSNVCTLAYWHHPRFSSGVHGNDASTQALWKALTDFNADVVLTGHDHNYERFAQQTSTGVLDNAHGVRSFVVGTGGKEQRVLGVTRPNSELRANSSLGVLKLTLHPTSFDWQFVPVPGDPLNDSGTQACVVPTGNQSPTAAISSPANGSTVVQGTSVSFAGTGSDAEDGALTGNALTWTSSIDGAIGTGTSFVKSNLSVGHHTITLTAKDAQNAMGTSTRTIDVTAAPTNQAPVARFTFTCPTLQCALDGSTSTDDVGVVRYTWNWGDGRSESHSGPTARNTWPAGSYNVTLTVTDGGGLTNSVTKAVQVPTPTANQPPTASITSPPNGASFVQGTSVSFAGTGSDPEDGALTGASLTWTSSRDGALGTGTSFSSTNLSVGQHSITLTAKDAQNATGSAAVTIVITAAPPVNQAPVANFTYTCATGVPHQCMVDGSPSTDDHGIVRYAWSWGNRAGEGHSFPTSKNTWAASGTYQVTLTVTDASGLTGVIATAVVVP